MLVIRSKEVQGHVTEPPYVRELKLLASPLLQPEVKNISLGQSILPPGCKSSSHVHDKETEYWIVLSGEGTVILDDEQEIVKEEDIIVVPPGVAHQLDNHSDDTFKVLWIYAPAGPEKDVLNKVHK